MPRSLVAGARELWTYGGHQRVARGTPITLHAIAASDGVNRMATTFRRHFAAAGYVVTAGQQLIITRLLFRATAIGVGWFLGYGDDDVGLNSIAEPTNPVRADAVSATGNSPLTNATALVLYDVPVDLVIPAGKFPYVRCTTLSVNVGLMLQGVELPA